MKKVLFIDRDGTLIKEPNDQQVDTVEKLTFYPEVIFYLGKIARELDYELVMVTNQDGLGTTDFPEKNFWPIQNFIEKTFSNESAAFKESLIDRTFPDENADTRKPNIGMLKENYLDNPDYDLKNSLMIGDRFTDVEFAKNFGGKGILITNNLGLGEKETENDNENLKKYTALKTKNWKEIYEFLKPQDRTAQVSRKTNETNIDIKLNVDGTGKSNISTGISFFDHMLDQLSRHGQMNLDINVKGDLDVDEHHTIEDIALALGEVFKTALGDKLGIERYGFCLPMDDCLAQVAVDFGGRNYLVWDATFNREMIGKMPTEMFMHFFKSFSDGAKSNLNIKAEGTNEHHKIEAIFKAFAKALKMAVKRDPEKMILPSTKGVL
jgi:imidazoleglycerol-phosphate dehydratase/histidinol-phosphatase